MNAMYCLLKDSCKEIELLVDVSNEQYRNLRTRQQNLERAMKDCIVCIEDPDQKPDLKT